jgi:hypothetical protein
MADDAGPQASGAPTADHPERFDPENAAGLANPLHIQGLLSQHPAVADSHVVTRADSSGSRLIAHVLPRPGSSVDEAELRRFLVQRVPDEAIPVFDLTGQRLGDGGETTQLELPPPATPAEPQAPHAGPHDPTEELLCEVWRELLGVEHIGINDDVFDLGAHSLTVMWAAARILDRTGLDLPSRWFYEEPTVAGLARLIAGAPPGGSTRGPR